MLKIREDNLEAFKALFADTILSGVHSFARLTRRMRWLEEKGLTNTRHYRWTKKRRDEEGAFLCTPSNPLYSYINIDIDAMIDLLASIDEDEEVRKRILKRHRSIR